MPWTGNSAWGLYAPHGTEHAKKTIKYNYIKWHGKFWLTYVTFSLYYNIYIRF